MSKILIPIVVGLIVLFSIIGLSNLIFGNLTETDSLKSLWVIIPVMAAVAYYLIKNFNKK